MATPNSKPQQDQQGQQSGILTNSNLWNSDVARANQLGGNASAPFGLANDGGGIGRNNVVDALMLARLQQQQQQNQDQQQHQHDALRRLSIDTIGSSHRSAGLDGANGLMSVANRLNTNNLLQHAHSLQQQQGLLGNNNQFLTSQQRELQSQLQQAGIGGGGMGSGLYPRSDSLSYMQNFDPSSAAVANLRFQQGLAGMGGSGLNGATGSNLSQSLLSNNLLPGNQMDFPNSGSNSMLDMDFLYRALLQQQQQQKQQSDSLLNLHLNQQQRMSSFGNDAASRSDLQGGSRLEPNVTGLDNMTMSAQQNRFQGPSTNGQPSDRTYGSDQLDWSRNSETNIDSSTLLSLQQQQLQQQQQQMAEMNQMNYQGVTNNQMMNFEDQLALNSSMWNYPSSVLNLQQQNQLFSQQFQGGGNLDGDMGAGGIGSNTLLSALFAESTQAPFELGMPMNASANLGSLNNNINNEIATSAATKPAKAPAENAAQLPVRALSAYNFFFRDERERIINCDEGANPLDPSSLTAKRNSVIFNDEKKKQLLSGHWFRDRTAKRRHRKTHGKIAFTALSKVIAQAWRELPDNEKGFYRDVATEDLERYQRELEQYKVVDGVVDSIPKLTTTTAPPKIQESHPSDDSEPV